MRKTILLFSALACACATQRGSSRVWTATDCIAIDDGLVQRAWSVDVDEVGRTRLAEIAWSVARTRIADLPEGRGDPRPAMAWPAGPFG